MDGISLNRLKRLKEKVCSEKYIFNTVKLTYIRYPGGKRRPLGLPTTNNKIVQEVIRIILDAISDPIFSKLSFGFQTGLGYNDDLDYVEARFR